MAFALMDDQIHGHPKFARAGLEAIGLWALGLSYCSQYLTDGLILREIGERLAGSKLDRLAVRLVTCGGPGKAGLWDAIDGGWLMHDYLDWNPSREEVLGKREAERQRKAGGRSKQGRDETGRITSARNPAGHTSVLREESSAGHTGSHAHAHSPITEIPPTRARACDGSRLQDAWLSATGNIGTGALSEIGLRCAEQAATLHPPMDPDAYAEAAIHRFVQWVDGIPNESRRPQKSPAKFLEHLPRVHEMVIGKRASVPARYSNFSEPRPPVAQTYEEEDFKP